jgi:hypothetical protein
VLIVNKQEIISAQCREMYSAFEYIQFKSMLSASDVLFYKKYSFTHSTVCLTIVL